MLHKTLLRFVVLLCISSIELSHAKYLPQHDQQFHVFTTSIEQLILNTTHQALLVTKAVYTKLSAELSPQLQQHTPALEIMRNYSQAVEQALAAKPNYTQRRRLLQQFKANNWQLEHLRQQFDPVQPHFELQLLSPAFISDQRHNVTAFDNLYLHFMREFAKATQRLWDTMSEQFVEDNEELLELLDEISNEQNLREKDKLYDEFIATYLFKKPATNANSSNSTGDAVENREIDEIDDIEDIDSY